MKTNFKSLVIAILAMPALMCISNNVKAQDDMSSDKMGKMKVKDDKIKMKMHMSEMKNWAKSSQMAAKEMMEKYGNPDEATPTMLVWNNNGIWKKTVISKEESTHNFPKTHTDCMVQSISYRVSPEKFTELGNFDGSVTVDRTQGTIAARCDKEENNMLALNLAYDIIQGRKTVAEARKSYGDMIMQAMNGNKPEYMMKLMFSSNMNAPDADINTINR